MNWESIGLKERSSEFLRQTCSEDMTPGEKLLLMKDMYLGKNVYIVSCGPSLAGLSSEHLITSLQNVPVLTIKQAFEKMHGYVDIHHYNCNNFTGYDTPETIVLASSSSAQRSMESGLWSGYSNDIFFKIKGGGNSPTLCGSCDFDNNTFDKTGTRRMWGPGTLFETTLFTAIHAGASKISLIGVDLGPSDFQDAGKSLGHFYDAEEVEEIKGSVGILFKGENELTKSGFSELHKWLDSRGVELEICSEDSYLPDSIPRNLWLYGGGYQG